MSQQQQSLLTRIQLPPVQYVRRGKDWNSLWEAFKEIQTHDSNIVTALQAYFSQLYNVLVPMSYPLLAVTPDLSPYHVGPSDEMLVVSAATIVLPQSATSGRAITAIKIDPTALPVTLQPYPGDKINGAVNYSITNQYDVVTICDVQPGQWVIIGKV